MGAGPAGEVVRPMEQTLVNAFAALSRARNTINKQVASAAGGHQPPPPLQNFMSGYISAEAYFCLKAFTEIARGGPSSMDLPMYSQENRWHSPSSPRCSCTGYPMFPESLVRPSVHHNALNPSIRQLTHLPFQVPHFLLRKHSKTVMLKQGHNTIRHWHIPKSFLEVPDLKLDSSILHTNDHQIKHCQPCTYIHLGKVS